MKYIIAIIQPDRLDEVIEAAERGRDQPDDRLRRDGPGPAERRSRGLPEPRGAGRTAAQDQDRDRGEQRQGLAAASTPSPAAPARATSATARYSCWRWRSACASAPARPEWPPSPRRTRAIRPPLGARARRCRRARARSRPTSVLRPATSGRRHTRLWCPQRALSSATDPAPACRRCLRTGRLPPPARVPVR